ncbi:MAG: FAD-dependent oxidoreductase [bacterium]
MARKIKCQVERVTNHGDRVYTVELNPGRPFPAFRPGQFLHLAVDEYDPSGFWPESRVFSIASSPQDRDQLVISYSVKGVYTTRMERELALGKHVWVKLPYGDFVVDGTRDVVLIAGGTGITAFRAFISGLKADHGQRVRLLYGARKRELLLGMELIEQKRKDVASFDVVYFSERDTHPWPRQGGERVRIDPLLGGVGVGSVGGVAPLQPDPVILSGRVRLDVLADCCFDGSPVYYLAGPPVMLTAFRQELAQCGVPEADIRVDAWE